MRVATQMVSHGYDPFQTSWFSRFSKFKNLYHLNTESRHSNLFFLLTHSYFCSKHSLFYLNGHISMVAFMREKRKDSRIKPANKDVFVNWALLLTNEKKRALILWSSYSWISLYVIAKRNTEGNRCFQIAKKCSVLCFFVVFYPFVYPLPPMSIHYSKPIYSHAFCLFPTVSS